MGSAGDEILRLLVELAAALVDLILRGSAALDSWGVNYFTQIGLALAILYEVYLFTQGENITERLMWIPRGLLLIMLWDFFAPTIAALLQNSGAMVRSFVATLFMSAHVGLFQTGRSPTIPDIIFNGPVMEEVVFRFPILLALRNGMGGYSLLVLALLSSAIFGALHSGATIYIAGGGTVRQATALQAFGFGLVQCYLVYRTESPLVIFAVHIISNAI